jgi:hypothetical protein
MPNTDLRATFDDDLELYDIAEHRQRASGRARQGLASRVGFEPTTKGLKVPCSTAELPAHRQRT